MTSTQWYLLLYISHVFSKEIRQPQRVAEHLFMFSMEEETKLGDEELEAVWLPRCLVMVKEGKVGFFLSGCFPLSHIYLAVKERLSQG